MAAMTEKKTVYEGKYLRMCVQGHWEYAERTNAGSAVIIIIPGWHVMKIPAAANNDRIFYDDIS